MSVSWKIQGIFNADAEKVDIEIKSIGENVTPQQIYDYAKNNPKSELHKCFEWDNLAAAEKYRLMQARKILVFIVRVPTNQEKPQTPLRYISMLCLEL